MLCNKKKCQYIYYIIVLLQINTTQIIYYLVHMYLFCTTINWRANRYRTIGWRNRQNVKGRSHIRRAERWGHSFQLNSICLVGWWSSLNWIEDAITGLDPITTQMERPIHRKENIVVNDIRFMIFPSLFCIQGDDIYNFSYAKSTSTIWP